MKKVRIEKGQVSKWGWQKRDGQMVNLRELVKKEMNAHVGKRGHKEGKRNLNEPFF